MMREAATRGPPPGAARFGNADGEALTPASRQRMAVGFSGIMSLARPLGGAGSVSATRRRNVGLIKHGLDRQCRQRLT